MQGEIEIDESNLLIQILGAKRVRGKRGRVAGKKTPVFQLCLQLQAEGMLKRNNCVYTQIVKHCLADELLPIIRYLSNINETGFYSDYWGGL